MAAMGQVHIIQLLCPSRHCIMAVAYNAAHQCGDEAHRILKTGFETAVEAGVCNDRCGICGSRTLAYEDRATIFDTLEAATPSIMELQHNQALTRAIFETAGMTYDRRRTEADRD
jgi:hypothetical protein